MSASTELGSAERSHRGRVREPSEGPRVSMTASLAAALLAWYDGGARDLPWRREPSPYGTLVSEFMLQQTGVATVEPFFRRFLARFPTVEALAAASDDEVTALWSGLGYYARARNLRRAAAAIVDDHGGRMPRTEAELRTLPGVGPYTAAAVAAIAFGERVFALDGNGLRVLARLTGERGAVDRPATRVRLHARGLAEVPADRAGDFNQAVMELGATVCRPRNPDCAACPLARRCRARAAETVGELPRKTAKPARPVVRVVCACVTDGARVLLLRRPAGLLGGTWALPEAAAPAGAPASAVARRLAEGSGVAIRRIVRRGSVRHVFTHRDVTAEVFRVDARAAGDGGVPSTKARWLPLDGLGAVGVSTFTRKTVAVGMGQAGAREPGAKADKAAISS
jgi:A/G-specific adenine glycosylase